MNGEPSGGEDVLSDSKKKQNPRWKPNGNLSRAQRVPRLLCHVLELSVCAYEAYSNSSYDVALHHLGAMQ